MQIAIFEILQSLGIVPNEIVGDSYGKFAKAYADGLLTIQQSLIGAYGAAKFSLEKNGESFEFWHDLKNTLNDNTGNLGIPTTLEMILERQYVIL